MATERSLRKSAADPNSCFVTGKVIFGYSDKYSTLAVIAQPDGVKNGISLGGVQDRIYASGFNNAVDFDGSDSATLLRKGVFVAEPGYRKNATIGVGIAMRRRG